MSSSSFLVHSQSSIEVRQFFRTNFIKSLLSDYMVYGVFVLKKLLPFVIVLVLNNFKVQTEV